MNLRNLSEREFDAKLKDYLDHTNVPFDPESWDKMDKKLDMAFPGNSTSKGQVLELSIVALVLSSLFFWSLDTFPDYQLQDEIASVRNEIPTGAENIAGHDPGIDSEDMDTRQQVAGNTDAAGISKNEELKATQSNALSVDSHQAADNTNHTGQAAKEATALASTKEQAKTTESDALSVDAYDAAGHIDATDQAINKTTEPVSTKEHTNAFSSGASINSGNDSESSVPTSSQGAAFLSFTGKETPDQSSLTNLVDNSARPEKTTGHNIPGSGPHIKLLSPEDLPDVVQATEMEDPVPVIKGPSSSLLIGFGASPDISLVGFGESTKPGTSLSLMVEYQMSSRWSISSGIAYSLKKYKADDEDYHPPEGYWDYGGAPEHTEATCDVIDIPINIRYYIKPTRSHGFFASTGLSSYLMLTEDYYYEYENNYDPNNLKSLSLSNENRHLFSIYNFSLGYQKSVGNRWLFEIEPFIKIPLKGVGFGEVDLWSTGSYFSFKYRIK